MYPYVIHKMGSATHVGEKIQRAREDVLTSLVFGGMKYLPGDLFLNPFLEQIELGYICEEQESEISFWPSWDVSSNSEIEDRDRIEPDWIIETENNLIVGESKFGSGLDENQLNREWVEARFRFPEKKEIHLIALTNKITDQDLTKKREGWRWVGWEQMASLVQHLSSNSDLTSCQQRIIDDLQEALHSFGIVPFHLFKTPDDQVGKLIKDFPFVKTTQKFEYSFEDLAQKHIVDRCSTNFPQVGCN